MKVSYTHNTTKFTFKGKKKPLLKFLSSLVHVLGTAKASGLPALNSVYVGTAGTGVKYTADGDQLSGCNFTLEELPALKAARRAVAAKVFGVSSL